VRKVRQAPDGGTPAQAVRYAPACMHLCLTVGRPRPAGGRSGAEL